MVRDLPPNPAYATADSLGPFPDPEPSPEGPREAARIRDEAFQIGQDVGRASAVDPLREALAEYGIATATDVHAAFGEGGIFNGRSASPATPLPPTWCATHHAYDHCQDAVLARMEREQNASSAAPRPEGLAGAIAYAIARAPVPAKDDTPRVIADRLAPLVIESGYLASDTGERPYIAPPMQDWPDHASLSCDES